MKAGFVVAVAVILLSQAARAEDKTQPTTSPAASNSKGSYETVQAKVLKVYAFDDDGAKFRGYVVKWKDHEIFVSDPLGRTDKKEGDLITFMAMRHEMTMSGIKTTMLTFMIMDFPPMPQAGRIPGAVPPF